MTKKGTAEAPGLLTPGELADLIRRVFDPRPEDTAVAFVVDLPDRMVPDDDRWRDRRRLARSWAADLAASDLGLPVRLFGYRNPRMNNADLPATAWLLDDPALPEDADALDAGAAVPFSQVFREHTILLAPTRFSATAPLKLQAPSFGFRAATMPGLSAAMVPALRLDWEEVDRRCRLLRALLDEATGAELVFRAAGREARLHLDLRHRRSHASGGLLRHPGTAGNLPSGETYVVPYEGERPGEPSRSSGLLPVELEGEVVFYEIEGNRAHAVLPGGPVARAEAELLRREPAYGNLAELGLGVLAELGIEPIGEILLDEKLGLHVAFGRSDHFGGQVGAADFSRPEAVVHVDRVYLPQTQPQVEVESVDLVLDSGPRPLLRDGAYVSGTWRS